MTRQQMEFIRDAFNALDDAARFHPYAESLRERAEKALDLLQYEIDLMCADEAEHKVRHTMPEIEAMAHDASELFTLGFDFCRKHRAA